MNWYKLLSNANVFLGWYYLRPAQARYFAGIATCSNSKLVDQRGFKISPLFRC